MKKIVCALLSALMLPLSTVTVQAQETELVDLGTYYFLDVYKRQSPHRFQ